MEAGVVDSGALGEAVVFQKYFRDIGDHRQRCKVVNVGTEEPHTGYQCH